ncbi:hypothetical protein ABD74_14150 [Brevibacillus laterosporus]|nr:hypothetical protein [Brevibacillus laterosporus]
MTKIGLTGRARAGKDQVAYYLRDNYGYSQFTFGDELKHFVHGLFGKPASGTKPRELYQWFGQTMRQRDPDIWTRKLFENINSYCDPVDKIVISDARQPNEIDRLRSEGFVIIRVNASEATRRQRMIDAGDTFTDADLDHETEQHVDTFAVDYELDNNGSVLDLYEQIDVVMREIMHREAA